MENRQNKPPEGGAASGHGGQKFHTDSEQAKLHKSKLRMESREERLNKARERLAKQKPPKKPGPIKRIARIAGHETHAFLHGKVYQEERDNVGVEGGHFVERSGEAALHYGRHKVRRAIREHPAKAAARAESRYIKATADYHSRKFAQEQPEAQSAATRLWHRHKLKREYQRKARETAKQTAKAAEQTASAMERFVREAAAFVKRHPVGTLLALGCLLVVLTLQSCMSSMVSVGNSTLAAIAASTYKAEDADMLGAEAAYCALEDELQRYDKATNKQFITVQTSGGNTFYIVIDYDKPTDEDGEQYQTYFLNMVDEADLLAAMQAAGGELPECSCADKCAVGAINTDCTVCAVNMGECQGKASEPAPVVEPESDPEPEQPKATGSGGMLLLALSVVVIGGGAGWYFKIYRPKKQRAAESEEDYGGEYDGAEDYDETDPEDDGPPWDEDGEE